MTEMHKDDWVGVMPAITTPFDESLEINLEFMRRHARQMVDAGCTGIVTPGSLGEGGQLSVPPAAGAEPRCCWACMCASADGAV